MLRFLNSIEKFLTIETENKLMVILPRRIWPQKIKHDAKFKPIFGLCRLLQTIRRAKKFEPSKDLMRMYSYEADYDIVDVTSELMTSAHKMLTEYYRTRCDLKINEIGRVCIGRKVPARVPQPCYDTMIAIYKSKNNSDRKNLIEELAIRTYAVTHYLGYSESPNGVVTDKNLIYDLLQKSKDLTLLESLLRLTNLPPEWRGLDYLPNHSVLANSPREYASNDIVAFHNKQFDTRPTNVSRATTRDPFALFITTAETASINYGKMVSNRDEFYRILCDIFYIDKDEDDE